VRLFLGLKIFPKKKANGFVFVSISDGKQPFHLKKAADATNGFPKKRKIACPP
jgi:hypothetical protein